MRIREIKRILVIRDDGIGDLVLTLPAIRLLAESIPDVELTLFARNPMRDLVRGETFIRGFIPSRPVSVADTAKLFRQGNFDVVVHFYSNRRNLLAAYRAGIPVRVGPVVHLLDRMFLTHPRRQQRSKSLKNEAEYCIELLQELGIPSRPVAARLSVPPGSRLAGEEVVKSLGVRRRFVVIHPGMKGSARNWPLETYRALAFELSDNYDIVFSIGPDDEQIRQRLPRSGNIFTLDKKLSLGEYLSFLRQASGFVGPSTGPTHLAAALGVPTFGVYSPVRVHHPRRWGFYGAENAVACPPAVDCPEKFRCAGSRCPYYDCMSPVDPLPIFREIRELLRKGSRG